jgi:hypothetical protein
VAGRGAGVLGGAAAGRGGGLTKVSTADLLLINSSGRLAGQVCRRSPARWQTATVRRDRLVLFQGVLDVAWPASRVAALARVLSPRACCCAPAPCRLSRHRCTSSADTDNKPRHGCTVADARRRVRRQSSSASPRRRHDAGAPRAIPA